uniref:hypothetical protein n=1 Tax=Salmonella enterica TaxID=28901 RepID=UPI003298922D
AAEAAEVRIGKEVAPQDAQAVEEMKKRGLKVTTVSDEAAWRQAAEALGATTRGDVVDVAIYDAALAAREAFRAKQKKP